MILEYVLLMFVTNLSVNLSFTLSKILQEKLILSTAKFIGNV